MVGLNTDWQKEFIEYLSKRNPSSTWLREYKRTIHRIMQYLTKKKLPEITKVTEECLIEFQKHLYNTYNIKQATMRIKVVVLRVLFGYLYHKGLILSNPAYRLKVLTQPDPALRRLKRYYSWEELRARWFKKMQKANYSWRGIKQRLFSLDQFIEYLKQDGKNPALSYSEAEPLAGKGGTKTIYKITQADITRYKTYLVDSGYKEFSIKIKLYHLDLFFRFISYCGILMDTPTKGIDTDKRAPIPEESPKPKEVTEIELFGERFISWRLSHGLTDSCLTGLSRFTKFLLSRDITKYSQVTKKDILDYQNTLYRHRIKNDRAYKRNTIQNYMIAVFSLFKFLINYEFISTNPLAGLDIPKGERGLPSSVMFQKEVEKLLNAPDTLTPIGIRDRAIMEVLYSTGMRANELVNLVPCDIDMGMGIVKINYPKGGPSFQRVIPIGYIACLWVNKYINESRICLDTKDLSYLFLTTNGNKLDPSTVTDIIKDHRFRLGIKKNITSHSFRATCATLMLTNGASIRHVQEQLGHNSIVSTQVYTRVIPKGLKQVHQQYHPREREAQGLTPILKKTIVRYTKPMLDLNTKTYAKETENEAVDLALTPCAEEKP